MTNITTKITPNTITGGGGVAAMGILNFGMDQAAASISANRNYRIGKKQMEDQRVIQNNYQKQQYDLQKRLWEETGPVGQMDQYKKAGLNPALMYGMGGGGGQTAAVGTGPSASIPSGGSGGGSNKYFDPLAYAQLELLQANKLNIEADTRNKETEATYRGGPQTKNIQADTVKKDQEQYGIGLDNALKHYLQTTDKDGNNVNAMEGSIMTETKKQELNTLTNKIKEIEQSIKLMREQGKTQEEIQIKTQNESKILQAEIDWNALDIKGDNIGKVITNIIKMIFKPR